MSKLWCKRYEELTAFINDQPQVEIAENSVSIDETVRDEFYQKFNAVRLAFLSQNFPGWLDKAQSLSAGYGETESTLRERLDLQAILMPVALQRFLSDPMEQVVRDLFDPLFEMLQGKIEDDVFEEKGRESVRESFQNFYQKGYIKWFILNLIKNSSPEKIFEVPLPQPTSKQLIKHREDVLQNVPFPCETKTLSFEVGRRAILLAPDFIVQSKELKKYVAFRTEIGKALWSASYHSEKREWLSIAALIEKYGFTELKPDLLLYMGDQLEDLSLVADSEKFCRPDLAVFFMDQLEDDPDPIARKMARVRLTHDILKPLRGTVVLADNDLPENILKDLDENIDVVQFDTNKMNWDVLMAYLQK